MKLFPDESETIAGTLRRLHDGETSCVETVERCLAKIDAREADVHAWVSVDSDGALRHARELDSERAPGKSRGSLHGIPLAIKDIVDLRGTPTGAGSKLLAQGKAVDVDAPVAAKLKAAGAIILGKTVTTQFASFDPPVTRNPWDLDHTPGGSSSGSAAAVACGMCLGAIGSQTGGSITRPASFCGVAGCKPTFGYANTEGIFPLSPNLDHPGPIARTVLDLAILLDVIAEPVPVMNPWRGQFGSGPRRSVVEALRDSTSLRAPRLGRMRGFFDDLADPAARAALDDLLAGFSEAGATVRDAPLPQTFHDIHRSHRVVMATEAARFHKSRFTSHRHDYLPCVATLLEEGLAVSEAEYASCREHQERARQEILASLAEVDVLVCLGARGPAPDITTTGDPAFNSPWSYVGLPLVSFPFTLAPNDLPIAIQLIGRPFDEPTVFRAAAWCERIAREAEG